MFQHVPYLFIARQVTVIDWVKSVFVLDLVSPTECNLIRHLASEHLTRQKALGRKDVYRTLFTYTHMDIPCAEVQGLSHLAYVILLKATRIIGVLYGSPNAGACLRPRSILEPHLLKVSCTHTHMLSLLFRLVGSFSLTQALAFHQYQKLPGLREHTGCPMHYDGSHFTLSLMLSDPSEYTGGGTYIRCLRTTIKLRKGQMLVHPGSLFHRGIDITWGTRELLVCFMDGFSPGVADSSSEHKDRKEYESNVLCI